MVYGGLCSSEQWNDLLFGSAVRASMSSAEGETAQAWECVLEFTEDLLMKTLLVLAAIILAASAANFLDEEWNIWKLNYEKKYINSKEEGIRRRIWEETWEKVQKHNSLVENGLKNYTLAMNMFADMTVRELIQKTPCNSKNQPKPDTKPASTSNYTWNQKENKGDVVDWRASGCVTPVKNAGLFCRAWWAFGMKFECKYKPKKSVKVKVSKFYTLTEEESITNAVAEDGPVSVTLDVTQEFFLYNGGVYDGTCYPGVQMGMTIVGLGSSSGTDYWLLKNSWGKAWGEEGYVRVKRNVNQCGIADNAVTGDVAAST
ncbi:PREDICTED: cathepsin L-like proteinase [Nanorana parkeri]|uniref:cathepsin L-like proteinase n=1 Tax=Nanorana parkeri TaxID=125878 RepID=UPI000854862B|nr:PREDICTED: cathepsin L-like proteinase [Nanorana parkeri]